MVELDILKKQVEQAYESSVTMEEAERFAAKCLSAQLSIAEQLSKADLDSRFKKNGLKALKAAIWHESATQGDKKPSDKHLDAMVDMNKLVQTEQSEFDKADSYKESLYILLGIFKDAHIYFRGISKGSYNG